MHVVVQDAGPHDRQGCQVVALLFAGDVVWHGAAAAVPVLSSAPIVDPPGTVGTVRAQCRLCL